MVRWVFGSIGLGLLWQLGSCQSAPLSNPGEGCDVLGTAQQPFNQKCFQKTLEPVADPERVDFGQVPCRVATIAAAGSPECDCRAHDLLPADGDLAEAAREDLEHDHFCNDACCEDLCFCELPQLSGADLEYCWDVEVETRGFNEFPVGWCYVEPDAGFGNPELVAACPADSRRLLRLIPDGSHFLVLICQG